MFRRPIHRAGVQGPQEWGGGQPLPDGWATCVAQDCEGVVYDTLATRQPDGKLVVWCRCGFPIPVCEHEHIVARIEAGEIVSTECLDCDLVTPERVAP